MNWKLQLMQLRPSDAGFGFSQSVVQQPSAPPALSRSDICTPSLECCGRQRRRISIASLTYYLPSAKSLFVQSGKMQLLRVVEPVHAWGELIGDGIAVRLR